MSKKCINIIKNGPYAVSGDIPLNAKALECDEKGAAEKWINGKEYKIGGEPYFLCRCGRSMNKPFCDSTHEEIGFRGAENADRTPYEHNVKRYEGKGVDLLDNKSLCAEARFCDKGETIWKMIEQTDNPDVREEVIKETYNCPSGRLTLVTREGQHLEPELPEEISIVEDPSRNCRGPLWVQGGISVIGAQGHEYEKRNRVTLCRCGESANMPYCDATHYDCSHMEGLDS